MNTFLLLCAGAAVGILFGLGREVSKPLAEEKSARLINNIEELLPLHSQHLPQLRQSLASTDTRYVGGGPPMKLNACGEKSDAKLWRVF